MSSTYETDFYFWTQDTAQKLREGRSLDEWDLANVIEEIEDLGKAEYRTLKSVLRELIAHRLKWDYQQAKRSASWRRSINKQITKAELTLDESPSLRTKLEPVLHESYRLAVRQAAREPGLNGSVFPASCPYTIEQLFDSGKPDC